MQAENINFRESSPRCVITIATGPVFYWNMAINLARSIRLWHSPESLPITIVTDQPHTLPADLLDIDRRLVKSDELGAGFESKLHIDRLAPAQQTLFIDSDCLVYGSLFPLFDRLAGQAVAVIGGTISSGEWFGDVGEFCRRLGVSEIPKFNGGLYYVEPGETAKSVYTRARELVQHYDKLGLVRLRNQPNDELLMAAAMALQGIKAFPDDGTVMSDPQACPGPLHVNVLRGERRLYNPPPPSPSHQAWCPFTEVRPLIVHYLGHHARGHHYRAERLRLRLAAAGWPKQLAHNIALLFVTAPSSLKQKFKDQLRPLFHRVAGPRSVSSATR
ncbi:MAG: hypothetical protein QM715_02045 [Nibricoccus sp.]